ncbi:ImmA/IrrE family metallo-endopeptidase [Clostridium cellulovorans]|uniref:IrrE N-terminal-like domain-containing protein n=1 Tax=Clostridium cellulovorans (strain ATCC 35296 / DSM 3052 / OCM 3 / 743B) TaxID=573061 RepID=D9SQ34_CLOC7|nr:membrane protein [Clostridium cellulovorans]ADL52170.1 protein of unknown function DUF955 [Clostridium cellulovorans 743B]
MHTKELFDEVQKENIYIHEMDFKGDLKGLYSDGVIALDRNLKTDAEISCILSEELGHHYTTYGDIVGKKDIQSIKQEKRARRWAYERLIGINSILKACEAGTRNLYEMADYLCVTEEFLQDSLDYYKQKYGIMLQLDSYIVYFEPSLVIFQKKYSEIRF